MKRESGAGEDRPRLITDRWRFPVCPPRAPDNRKPVLADVTPKTVLARIGRPAYQAFWDCVQRGLAHAWTVDPADSKHTELSKADCLKVLALDHWLSRRKRLSPRLRGLLDSLNTSHWSEWCNAPDGILNYLIGIDLLRASGNLSEARFDACRDALAPQVAEACAIAPRLPQNNWRISTDAAVGTAALLWWQRPGKWPVEQWLRAALDGLERMLYGLLSADGAYEEGPGYSRRSVIPFIRFAWVYKRLSGVDLLNHEHLSKWHRWQVEVKAPDGSNFAFDDSGRGDGCYPHALLVHPDFRQAGLQRWAYERTPSAVGGWAAEAMLVFDDAVAATPPRWSRSRVLPDSGTAIFRSGWGDQAVMGLLLARPLRPLGTDIVNTAHRHDDPTHFCIAAHGQHLAIDSTYGGGYSAAQRYSYYLAPDAHNMILVDGKGPPRRTGYHADYRRGNVSQSDGRVVELCRSRRLYGAQAVTSYQGVDFRRSMFFVRERYFVVIDQVESPRVHEYAWLLHGAGEMKLLHDGAVWTNEAARLTARLVLPACPAVQPLTGHHGSDEDHSYIRNLVTGDDLLFAAVLVPDAAESPDPEIRLLSRDPVALSVRLAGARREDVFIWNPEGGEGQVELTGVGTFHLDGSATVQQAPR